MVAPPTYVTCQVGNTVVDVVDLYRDPDMNAAQYLPPSTTSPVTSVTVTLMTRMTGDYQCTVSVFRANMIGATNAIIDATSATVPVTG